MTKQDAFTLFGTARTGLARILGVEPPAISMLPKDLPNKKRREILGAALDHGIAVEKVTKFTKSCEYKDNQVSHNA